MTAEPIFAPADMIHAYTRAEALADGVLVDVTEWASAEKGFRGGFSCPVAMTSALWGAIQAIPPRLRGIADVRGRAHDVLFLARIALRGATGRGDTRADFVVILPRTGSRHRNVTLRAVIAGGDDGSPVVTVGMPEDF